MNTTDSLKICLLSFLLLFLTGLKGQGVDSTIQDKLLSFDPSEADSILHYRVLLAIEYRNKSQYVKAKEEFVHCAQAFHDVGKDSLEAVMYNNLGEVCMLMANYDNALYYHNQALDIRIKKADIFGLGASYLNMGNVYLYQYSLDTALIYYNKSIKNFELIQDSLRLASVYNNIGAIHSYIGNTEEVVRYWEKSLSIKEALNDKKAIAVSKNNLAELYLDQGELDRAEQYLVDAIAIKEQLENVESLATSYFNLAQVHKLQNKPEKSLSVLRKAEFIIDNSSSVYLNAELNNKLGNYYASVNNLDLAESYLLEAIKFADGGKMNDVHLVALEKISDLYENKGAYALALEYSDAYHTLKDSLLGATQQNKILELETKYDVKSKAQEIQLLQTEKKFQEIQNDRNKSKILYLILGLVLFSLTSILLLLNVGLKRKNNKLLGERNKIIEFDLETKNNLLEEIQVRVKKEQKKLAQVEMTALRTQMNPHFLFNGLNSINQYIVTEEPQKASDYLTKFSRLMRNILNNSKKQTVSLEEELSTLKLYMDIENLRHNNMFSYNVIIEDALNPKMIQIPPLLLQPYVENSIRHGIANLKDREGKIAIKIEKSDSGLRIIIEDNGVGMTQSKKINSKKLIRKESYGMEITLDRIKLINQIYNIATNVDVEEVKEIDGTVAGTRVMIYIPELNLEPDV